MYIYICICIYMYMYIYVYVYIHVCVGVCVCTIWKDVKPPFCRFLFFFLSLRWIAGEWRLPVTYGCDHLLFRVCFHSYLIICNQRVWMAQGPSREPHQQRFWFYTVVAIWDFLWHRFPRYLHGILLSWRRAKPRTLRRLFYFGDFVYDWFGFFGPMSFYLFAIFILEISFRYFRSLFLIQLHVKGFSSRRIDIKIKFYLVWFPWRLRHGAM